MRSDAEVNAEIAVLRKALQKPDRWNLRARKTIEETIKVLDERMTAEQIERNYYYDETDIDFEDGDNDLYNALLLVRYWLDGDLAFKAPSKAL
jgi:hypothetical protein